MSLGNTYYDNNRRDGEEILCRFVHLYYLVGEDQIHYGGDLQ